MRVVIDTDVLVAGVYSRNGASYQVLGAALDGRLEYAVSPLISLDYVGKIEDKVRDGLLDLPVQHYLAIAKALIEKDLQASRPVMHRPILSDSSDDKILECAIAARCDAILAFNTRHFPRSTIGRYGIVPMSPGEFMRAGGRDEDSL